MLSWIGPLLGLIPAGLTTIQGITTAISNEKIALINAKTDQERTAAQERLAALQTQRDVLIADSQHSKLDIYVRTLIALGPGAYLLKIFLWDKVIGAFYGCVGITGNECKIFETDPLVDPNFNWIAAAVVGFYFLTTVRK